MSTISARSLAAPAPLVAEQVPSRVDPPSMAALLAESLLYETSDSPFGLEARICLQLKGVPFRGATVTLRRLAPFRALNPLGETPVLVQGRVVVTGAARIARHLEAQRPEPSLIPPGPESRAYAALLEEWARGTLHPLAAACKWVNPANRRAALGNTVDPLTAPPLRPLVGRIVARRMRRRCAAQGWTPAALGRLEERLRAQLATLAPLLADRAYLLGRSPTLADVAVFAQLVWLRRYTEGRLVDDAPAIAGWLDRLAALPPVAAALAA